jgi:hypothetical protein
MLSKQQIFILILFSVCNILSAQEKVEPSNYFYSRNIEKQIIFYDDFSKFNNYWLLGTEENSWFENLEDGHLVFQSLTNKSKEDFLPALIDQKRDFEIEISLRFVKGQMDKGYGLQWGKAVNPTRQFDFLLTGAGQFTIDRFDQKFHDYVPFTSSENVNKYARNKLTVRKVKDKYYFFLNEKIVYSTRYEPFYGNLLGFQVGDYSTIEIEDINVAYLDSLKASKSKVLIMDYKFSTGKDNVIIGEPVTLTARLSNVGEKDARDLKINCILPDSVTVTNFSELTSLSAGEDSLVTIQFFANRSYHSKTIPIKFSIEGADITNANDLVFYLEIDKPANQDVNKVMAQNYSVYRGSNDDPLKGLNVAQAMKSIVVGEFYALVIGIDQYSGEWPPLQSAVNDAKCVAELLTRKYNFHQIRTLINSEATRENIIKGFEWLIATVKPSDNVLIYYSGHGDYLKGLEKGFWIPVDATIKSISKYISNEDIKSFLSGINSKHTLLISDACFSGDIFRGKTLTIPYENTTKYYQKVYSLKSRNALTSGGIEPVIDKGKEGHSIFAYYFLQTLDTNNQKYLDASQVYQALKIPVINNSSQTPMYNPIRNTFDEGGQFLFILK